MDAPEAVGTIAEILSWVGLGIGLPLLLIVLLVRLHDGAWVPVEVFIVDDAQGIRARWFTAGDFWERPVRPHEVAHDDAHEALDAFVSERDPGLMRFEPRRPVLHAFQVLGITLSAVGAAALVSTIILLFV